MAKSKKLERKSKSQHHRISLRKLSSRFVKVCGAAHFEKEASKKKEWENAVCSVCLEFPHNAVLLLCSSYEKGCRPYMCATSHRCSNCLEQYRKAYTKATPNQNNQSWGNAAHDLDFSYEPDEKTEIPELLCPLCRGQVKAWTVVEPARQYLNMKKRTCMQGNCSFRGTYKKLRRHVKSEHPLACPWEVDPRHAEKWKKLENERDLSDVLTTIRSTTPGAIVIGDYVIERNPRGPYGGDDYLDNDYLDDEYFGRAEARYPVAPRRTGYNAPPGQRIGTLAARRTGPLRGQASRDAAAGGNIA